MGSDHGTASLLRERLELVLASVDPRVARLVASGTSLTIEVPQAPEASVTILLDRSPPSVAVGVEPAEIAVQLTPEDAVRFATGELSLPAALMTERIPYRGPMRKYLAVHPVLRSLLVSLDRGELRG